ncbi:hypothetical protein PHYPSEUDO_006375 [Phytophthora pseudosyringae]|uniref:Uncharacterized protein n=1 Tax=Phytophthora pseudosyringae TaxID=221518 RepID=A0A8T1WCC3_9STRA|nr:hypothetical protein PHYPSEUDO_006375 [Phytophthora pseudosyringae]
MRCAATLFALAQIALVVAQEPGTTTSEALSAESELMAAKAVATCNGDLVSQPDGSCACPSDQVRDGNSDQCRQDGSCGCPSNKVPIGNSNQCKCPGNMAFVGNQCKCPGDQTLVYDKCSCPAGKHLENNACVTDCFWKANDEGFTCPWSDPGKSSLKLSRDCLVNAPVPKDNYVNDKRINKNDAALTDPIIAITATKEGTTAGTTKKATWKDYALAPGNLEDEITFGSFGVFGLSMTATDYRYPATCTGCIAIVDNYPPTADKKCQTTDTRASPLLYSSTNLAVAIEKEATFTSFYASSNIKNNGAYDSATGANLRVDDTSASLQNFFATTTSPLVSIDIKCFDNNYVTDLLDATPSWSPLTLTEAGRNALQCKRCCSKSRTLKEQYYDYKCGTAFAATTKKTATSDSCTYGQCLKMPSKTLVTASASVTSAAALKTATVVAGLPTSVASDAKAIHRSITCTSFSKGCTYTPTLGDLLDHSSAWGLTVPDSYKTSNYVFWRYSVGTESWHTWDDLATLTFTNSETTVYVEAWTHCGVVFQDSFKVLLHPHSDHDACEKFNPMWSELTAKPRTVESHMCAYPGSDFVLMKFGYDSEAGLSHTDNTVQGKYTDVKCYVKVAASGSLDSVTEMQLPLSSTVGTNGRIQVAKQFALELIDDATTAKNTDVKVRCDFTYTHFDATTTETEPCCYEFTITDCDRPEIETYSEEEVCKAGECQSPTGQPGPYEACAGSVFATAIGATTAKSVSDTCCTECSAHLACTALPESSGNGGVKRCEPATPLIAMALRGEGEWTSASTSSTFMGVLAATALVAVVALVAVKRRTGREIVEDDAYYPLLE